MWAYTAGAVRCRLRADIRLQKRQKRGLMADSAEKSGGTAAYTVLRFGEEGEPVVVIDDFCADPQALHQHALAQAYAPGARLYPGVIAPAPARYLAERRELLRTVLREVFGITAGADLSGCEYSQVTTSPGDLLPAQRLPHHDSTDPRSLALLHYLCRPEDGGTAFYRHCSTGFETITAERHGLYNAALQAELKVIGLPDGGYFAGSTDQFEQIGRVEAAFNRMVIHRGFLLHCGHIRRSDLIGVDGAQPRLTVNTFLTAKG